jgi:hypothetical protein
MKLINNSHVALRNGINNFPFVCCTLKSCDKKFFRKAVCCEIHPVVTGQYLVVVANFDEWRRVSHVKQEWTPNNRERKETRTRTLSVGMKYQILPGSLGAKMCWMIESQRRERRWRQHTDCDSAIFTFCVLYRSYWYNVLEIFGPNLVRVTDYLDLGVCCFLCLSRWSSE